MLRRYQDLSEWVQEVYGNLLLIHVILAVGVSRLTLTKTQKVFDPCEKSS